jgi:hypothetical protein
MHKCIQFAQARAGRSSRGLAAGAWYDNCEPGLGFQGEFVTTKFDAKLFLDAVAGAMGLEIAPTHRPGVVMNLQRLTEMARLVAEFPLPEEVEQAPVFRP